MDNYQAVYDAVRSKMSFINGQEIAQDITRQFDFSYQMEHIKNEFMNVAYEMQRPSVIFRPKIFKDGEMWCALLGDNIQSGVCGFGETPDKATMEFDKAWKTNEG